MKANELMVGDWVLINGNLRKIQAVDGIDDEIQAAEELYTLSEDRYHSEDRLEGVPITQEILEKNGFIRDGESWWYEDFRIVLFSSNGVSLICGRQMRFKYVHQLQHALCLCGIEKTIVL